MINFKLLLVCSAVAVVSSYPFGPQQLPNTHVFNSPQKYLPPPVTYNKQFHFYVAPEDESDNYDEDIPESLLRQNIRVVVIKAPEHKKLTTAVTRLAKTLAAEKTAIYILNKQPDLKEITTEIRRLKEEKTENPEVHFVKYKSAQEAELAALNIKSQYDALDGPSQINTEGLTQTHSFEGSLSNGLLEDKPETSVLLESTPSLSNSPLHISLPLAEASSGGISASVTPSSGEGIVHKLIVSSTVSPLAEENNSAESGLYAPLAISNLNTSYLPPNEESLSSNVAEGQISSESGVAVDISNSNISYLPPSNEPLTKKRSVKQAAKK